MRPDAMRRWPRALTRGSLRVRLVAWLLAPLLLLLVVGAWLTYHRALSASNAAFDRVLYSSAKQMQEGLRWREGRVEVDIPYVALEMFEANAMGRVFYRVASDGGEHLTGYEDLPLPPALGWPAYRPQYYDAAYRGDAVRAVALRVSVHDIRASSAQRVWVVVAETPEARRELARDILVGSVRQEGLLLIVALVIFGIAVHAVLGPIRKLSTDVAQRKEEDLSPLSSENLPSEMRPLVDALNQYTGRMHHMLRARRRFFDDAAHQLKTPLAVMQAQAELALRESQPQAMREHVREVLAAVQGAGRSVRQLMSLARLEPDSGRRYELAPTDVTHVVREAALEMAAVARARGLDLALEAPANVMALAEPQLLHELVASLVDNAVRHAHGARHIGIRLLDRPRPAIVVSDDGPGIPRAERENVLRRFYRIPGTVSEGSGLGLSIVREIARVHGGDVRLEDTPRGGLTVVVELRAAALP